MKKAGIGHAAKKIHASASMENAELAASRNFRQYRPEHDETVRKAQVKTDPEFVALLEAWKSVKFTRRPVIDRRFASLPRPEANTMKNAFLFDDQYPKIMNAVRNLNCSTKGVELTSLSLADFSSEEFFSQKAGLFLGAMINQGRHHEYIIHTSAYGNPIDYFGYLNTKIVTVLGPVGNYCGMYMSDGALAIKGNVRDSCGFRMFGGIIRIEGDAGLLFGDCQEGGELILSGKLESMWYGFGGKIFIQGRQAWPKS